MAKEVTGLWVKAGRSGSARPSRGLVPASALARWRTGAELPSSIFAHRLGAAEPRPSRPLRLSSSMGLIRISTVHGRLVGVGIADETPTRAWPLRLGGGGLIELMLLRDTRITRPLKAPRSLDSPSRSCAHRQGAGQRPWKACLPQLTNHITGSTR